MPTFVVLVLHMVVHDNTSGHLQLVLLRVDLLDMTSVLVMHATVNITIPPFVGGDYFCESGYNSNSPVGFHSNDPLWDGYGCTASSTCCSFNNPPYFTKQLPSPTTDDIEARMCQYNTRDDLFSV